MKSRVAWPFLLLFSSTLGCVSNRDETVEGTNSWPCYTLSAEKVWQLNTPNNERFDASGLLQKGNKLFTVNDRDPALCEIRVSENRDSGDIVIVPEIFTAAQLAKFSKEKSGRFDCEGIAQDSKGRIYYCEEGDRWILRFDPKIMDVERLPIDWAPVEKQFHRTDRNASFEGITIGDGKLFVANERQEGRIIVIDLKTLKILDDFTVRPTKTQMKDIHYSDLCWFDGALFAILRENRVVVKIDPKQRRIVAEYNFHAMEQQDDLAYRVMYPTSTMEGLAVDKNYFWLITDNNGWGRKAFPQDTRPTLFKCRKPE